MVRQLTKRKRPEKEDFLLKEHLKIVGKVFDEKTMVRINTLLSKGIIDAVESPVAEGKEASIFLAAGGKKVGNVPVILKIFRIETTYFFKRKDYMVTDPRFRKTKGGTYEIIKEWCKREYSNLKIANASGVHCPKPLSFNGNILIMELIKDDEKIAPTLKGSKLDEPEKCLKNILDDIRKMYVAGIVHSDISEYNILMSNGVPHLIDFGQAIFKDNPNANRFLARDIQNIIRYFELTYGIHEDANKVYENILEYE